MLKLNIIKKVFGMVISIGISFSLAKEPEGVYIPMDEKPFLQENSLLDRGNDETIKTEIITQQDLNSEISRLHSNRRKLMVLWGLSLTTFSFYTLSTFWPWIMSMISQDSPEMTPLMPGFSANIDEFYGNYCREIGRKPWVDKFHEVDETTTTRWCEAMEKSCRCPEPGPNTGYELFYLYRNTTSCIPEEIFADTQKFEYFGNETFNITYAQFFRGIGRYFGTPESALPSLDVFNKSLHDMFTFYCQNNLTFLRTSISSRLKGTYMYMLTNGKENYQYMESAPLCLKEDCVTQHFIDLFQQSNSSHSRVPENDSYANSGLFTSVVLITLWGTYFMSFLFS